MSKEEKKELKILGYEISDKKKYNNMDILIKDEIDLILNNINIENGLENEKKNQLSSKKLFRKYKNENQNELEYNKKDNINNELQAQQFASQSSQSSIVSNNNNSVCFILSTVMVYTDGDKSKLKLILIYTIHLI